MAVRQVTVKSHGFTLVKDLTDNERLCPTCDGLGLVIRSAPYRLSGDLVTSGKHFPYDHKHVGACSDCYLGVQTLCPHCGRALPKSRTICDCSEARKERDEAHAQKERERVDKAEKMTREEAISAGIEMIYAPGPDRFFTWDELDDFCAEAEEDPDEFVEPPTEVWACKWHSVSFDAHALVENATEDLYEDAYDAIPTDDIKQLQILLDEWAVGQASRTKTFEPDYKRLIILEPARGE